MNFKFPLILSLFAFVLLTACGQKQGNNFHPFPIKNSPISRMIEVSGNQPELEQVLQKSLLQKRSYALVHGNNFSEFKLFFEARIERIASLETKPLLMGRLQKTTSPVQVHVVYKLANAHGQIITEGHFSEVTQTQLSVYPKLEIGQKIPDETLQILADKVITEIDNHVRVTTWSSRIISHKNHTHAVIYTSSRAGLRVGDILSTETQPHGKLQVTMFEAYAGGEERGVVALKEGFMPAVGQKLILEKRAAPEPFTPREPRL